MQRYRNNLRRALLIGALTTGTLAAGAPSPAAPITAENVWTPQPTVYYDGIPGRLFLTSDPAVAYAVGGMEPLRSEDGGRHWTVAPTPSLANEVVVDPADPLTIFYPTSSTCCAVPTAAAASARVLAGSFLQAPARGGAGFRATSPGRVYFATLHDLWQSPDGGATFIRRGALPGSPGGEDRRAGRSRRRRALT